jgi:hypothetical protein
MVDTAGASAKTSQMSSLKEGTHLLSAEISKANILSVGKLYPADRTKEAQARALVERCLHGFLPMSSSTLTWVMMSTVRQIYHAAPQKDLHTMAVTLGHDRVPALLINVDFVLSLGDLSDIGFVLSHEAMHLLCLHLWVLARASERELADVAREAFINYYLCELYNCTMPKLSTGEATGVDPRELYEEFCKIAKGKLTTMPQNIAAFYATDESAYRWMAQLPEHSFAKRSTCGHMGDGAPGDMVLLDEAAASELSQQALDSLLKAATKASSAAAKEELIKIMEATKGNEKAEGLFGTMGASELLGTTTKIRKTNFWDRQVARMLGRLVVEDDHLAVKRKQPKSRILGPNGIGERHNALVVFDHSGSFIGTEALRRLRAIAGATHCLSRWLWFDDNAQEFALGDEVYGGGGTNGVCIEEWILSNYRTYPDAVVVVTDGQFAPFTPSKPDRWIWLLNADGTDWMSTHTPRMKVQRLPH